jgi:hypothetical protein
MRILVAGLPRSGTSWFAEALSHAPGVSYVAEPDNAEHGHYASVGLHGLGVAPALAPGERAPAYERLWAVAFSGGWPANRRVASLTALANRRRVPPLLRAATLTPVAAIARRRRPSTEHQMVKTVRANQSVEWIADRFSPFVIIVWRNPLNALPGLMARDTRMGEVGPGIVARLRETEAWPPPPLETFERAAWNTCARMTPLIQAAGRHPEWLVVQHEALCEDPVPAFQRVFDAVGLEWSAAVEGFLDASNRPDGGTFETKRVTREQVDLWKKLTDEQRDSAEAQMRRFLAIEGMRPCVEASLAPIEEARTGGPHDGSGSGKRRSAPARRGPPRPGVQ